MRSAPSTAEPETTADLERALEAVLKAFRPARRAGSTALLGGRRIDKLLFAATKADHVHHTSHDRLEAILRLMTERAGARSAEAGAEVKVMALASLRATRETEARDGKTILPCIVGTPLPGERLAGTTFDGRKEAAVFPGDLPTDPRDALERGLDRRGLVPALPPATAAHDDRERRNSARTSYQVGPGPRLSHRRLARMSENREPRVFAPDDPNILPGETWSCGLGGDRATPSPPASSKRVRAARASAAFSFPRSRRWSGLALSVSFAQFVSSALGSQ